MNYLTNEKELKKYVYELKDYFMYKKQMFYNLRKLNLIKMKVINLKIKFM